jgi:hypothetical protein
LSPTCLLGPPLLLSTNYWSAGKSDFTRGPFSKVGF